jgi:hypothetical protein
VPLGNQFVNQRGSWLYVLADQALGPLQATPQSCDTQFVVYDSQDHFVSYVDAKRLAERSRNDDAAVLVDTHAGF